MRVRRVVVAASVLILGAVAGCSDSSGSSDSSQSPAPEETASSSAPDLVEGYPTYVALGDSYTAAPGVPTTDQTTGCLQSDGNYPHLLAQRLDTTLDDVSCSGASTLSLVGAQQVGGSIRPAQFEALTADTSLVTLGMGGNDEDLFTTIVGTCLQVSGQDPTGSPCTDQLTAGGTDQIAQKVATIADRISAAVAGVTDRAPQAEVLVVGYPQPIPASGTCDALPLAAGDYSYARQAIVDLDTALEKAAADNGATYVDVLSASEGHDICAGDDAWVNGATTDPARALAFHPFAVEQQAVADLVLDALQG